MISKIKPLKLEVKNFISYKEEIFNFKSGLFYITGKNGAGKTNFFIESFSYLLYGKSMSGKLLTHLINKETKKGMIIKGLFLFNNKHLYIERGESPKLFNIYVENAEQGNFKYDDLNFKKVEATAKNSDMQLWLEEEILKMNNTDFISFVLKSAKKDLSFLELSKDERAKYFENLFNLSVFRKMADESKLKQKDQETIYNNHKIKLDKYKVDLDNIEYIKEEKRKQFEEHKQELYNNKLLEKNNIDVGNKILLEENKKSKEMERQSLEFKLKQKELNYSSSEVASVNSEQSYRLAHSISFNNIRQKELNLEKAINDDRSKIQDLDKQLLKEKQEAISSGKSLASALTILDDKSKTLNNIIQDKKSNISKYQVKANIDLKLKLEDKNKSKSIVEDNKIKENKAINEIDKVINNYDFKIKSKTESIISIENDIKDLFKTDNPTKLFAEIEEMLPKMSKYLVLKEYLTGTKNVYDKMISSIDNNKIELEQLRKDLDVKTIEQSKLKLNIVEIENNLNILNDDILQIKSDIGVIEKDKLEYNTLLNEIQLLENELLQVKIELEKANNNLQVARQNFKNIESKKQLQEEQLLKNIEKSEKLIEEYKTELNVLDEKLTQDIEKSKIQNERLKEQIKLEIEETKSWLKQVIEFLESLDVKLDTILNEYKMKVEKIEKEANDILKNKTFDGSEYSESIEKLKNSIEFEKSKYEEEYQKYIRLDSIRKILTAKFNIKNFLMEKFRPYLNKQISNYISIFRVPATIMFDENFELQLKGNDYDELSLKSLSAGEICKTSLAILLASMKVKREVFQNNEFMLMILDEVLTNVDKESLNEILSIMKNNFEDEYFIGIVQHNIDSECEANVIEITKNNKEGSKIKIL